jgi:hypothetical protein
MSDSAPPAAGWYADPENPAGERWWNGSGWSDHKRASTVAETATPAAAPFVPPTADSAGFAFGTGSAADGRPDPYTPPAQPYYGAPTASSPTAPYSPSPYSPAPYGAPAYGSGTNGLALAGLIVSAAGWLALGIIASIAGIILSAFGLAQARKREAAGNPNTGRSLAMAGLVVGIVVTAIGLILVIGYVGLMMSLTTSGYY